MASTTCPECGRRFNLTDPADAGEWFAGHDCEPPEVTARVGLRFAHARQIIGDGPDRRPDPCVVTRVARGVVYYRNSSGFLLKTPADRFAASVGSIIGDTPCE